MSESLAGQPLQLEARFTQALDYALALHGRQLRKGTHIPYIAHLLSVAALVIEDGGDEDQAIAGLLHDAPEDQGGMKVLEEIRDRFGERVAFIVDACTDTYESPKPPWRVRKEQYMSRLPELPLEVWRVSLADKLHNLRSIRSALYEHGDQVWERFNGGKDGTLWYYRSILHIFQQKDFSPMVGEFSRTLSEIEHLSQSADQFPDNTENQSSATG